MKSNLDREAFKKNHLVETNWGCTESNQDAVRQNGSRSKDPSYKLHCQGSANPGTEITHHLVPLICRLRGFSVTRYNYNGV